MKDVIQALEIAMTLELITKDEATHYAHQLFAEIGVHGYDETTN